MTQRRRHHSALALLILTFLLACDPHALALADDGDGAGFDCRISLDGGKTKYDLTSLAGEHRLSRTRETPPTRVVDELRFDLCADLEAEGGVEVEDQCPSGTRACLTMTNKKEGENDRVVAVIPLAISSALRPEITPLSSPRGVNVVLHGSAYPPTTGTGTGTDPVPQSLNVTLLCDTVPADPVLGADMRVEWRTPAGCAFSGESEGEKEKEGEGEGDGSGSGSGSDEGGSVGSGIGWFFLLLVIALGAYFLIGAYHNYSTYGATGADLIPHRDFWKDVPYVLRDVASHLCSVIRPSNRSGYIAV